MTLSVYTVHAYDLPLGTFLVPRTILTKGKEPVCRGGKKKRRDRLWDGQEDPTSDVD